jgi:hypothetical protein
MVIAVEALQECKLEQYRFSRHLSSILALSQCIPAEAFSRE